jgi:hypothetical protein
LTFGFEGVVGLGYLRGKRKRKKEMKYFSWASFGGGGGGVVKSGKDSYLLETEGFQFDETLMVQYEEGRQSLCRYLLVKKRESCGKRQGARQRENFGKAMQLS